MVIVRYITKLIHLWQNKALRDYQNEQAAKVFSSVEAMKTCVTEVADAANTVAKMLAEKPIAPEAVLLCDLNGIIIKCNLQSAELFLADVNNHAVTELLHFSENENWSSLLNSTPELEKTVAMAAIPYSGATFTAEVTIVRLADTPPNVPRVLMMIRRASDPELRERYRDVAERVQNALDQLNDRFARANTDQ